MASGVIARLNTEKGYGFIRVDGSKRDSDVFFHRSALSNISFEGLTEGQPVTFNLGSSAKGPRAEEVHVTD